MNEQIENMLREILEAIEIGTEKAKNRVENSVTNLDLRDVLMHTGEVYAGCIGLAICEVIKKYTEGEG